MYAGLIRTSAWGLGLDFGLRAGGYRFRVWSLSVIGTSMLPGTIREHRQREMERGFEVPFKGSRNPF